MKISPVRARFRLMRSLFTVGLATGMALTLTGALIFVLKGGPTPILYAADIDVGVTKASSSASPVVGTPFTYTVTITNSNTPTTSQVTLTDTLPASVTVASITPSTGSCGAPDPITCTFPSLAADDIVTVTIMVTPTSAGLITNTAGVGVALPDTDNNLTNNLYTLLLPVADVPVSGLAAANDSPTALGSATAFTATVGAGTGVSYTWNFGDGNLGAGSAPTHTYAAVGAYTALVTATNTANSMAATTSVTVDATITGLAAANSSPTTLGQSTTFTASIASGSNVNYQWNFGDGNTGTGSNPSRIYTNTGTYTGILTATNSVSTLTTTTPVTITNLPPTANAGTDQNVFVSTLVTLNGTGSSDPDGHLPLAYRWVQSGGTSVSLSNPAAASPTFTAPSTPAVITFTLTVTDARNLGSAPDDVRVTVADVPITGLTANNSSPTIVGQATAFTATVGAGSNVSYQWNFGDGNTGSGITTTRTYANSGNYTAVVTATNSVNSLTVTTPVTINNPVPTLTSISPVTATVGNPNVTLTLTGTNFVNGSVARWNGADRTTGFVSNTQLTATILAGDLAAPGASNMTVFNPPPGGGASGPQVFTVFPLVQFFAGTYTMTEGAGSALITATLSSPSNVTATVNVATSNGTAFSTSDYAATDLLLTFGPGTSLVTFTVPITNDTLYEGSEALLLTLSSPVSATLGSPASATLTIVDNDNRPTVQFSAPAFNVNEDAPGQTAVITATLAFTSPTTATDLTTLVNVATSDGSALAGSDYTALSAVPLTFAPGSTVVTFTVSITNDTIYEGDESLSLTLSSPTNADLGAPNAATLNIVENDLPPVLAFSLAAYSVGEVGPSVTLTVTLTGSTAVTATVGYTTTNRLAVAGNDYTAVGGTLTFTPTVLSQTITVPILEDAIYEFNETFAVTLTNPTSATIGAANPATVTIVDNDPAPIIALSASAYNVNEDVGTGTATITATLTGQTEITATVNYSTTNGTAAAGSDYTGVAGTLTFTPGVTSQTINVPITNDTTFETNETFTVTLSAQVSATLTSPITAVVTIVNDDPVPAVRYTPDPQSEFTALEGNSPAGYSVPITVTLDRVSVFAVTAAYSTTDGTAIAGADYVTAAGTLTFNPGITTQTFSVTVKGNTFNGPNKTVNLNLGSVVSATVGGDNPETLLIIDDDGPPQIYFSAPTYSRAEDASPATIQVNLSNASNLTVTAVVTITDGTASPLTDYNAPLTRTVTITGNLFLTSASFTIPITDDTTFEGDETINLALGSPVNAELAGFNETAVLTIQDNETQPTVRFTSGSYSVNENGGSAVITATLSHASAFTATVNVATSNGAGVGRATAGSDYTAVNRTLTFTPTLTTTSFTVPITNDTAFEGNEVLTLTLGAPISNTTLGSPNPATLTIVDNESPPTIQLSAPVYTVEEYGGSAAITATLAFAGGTTSSAVPVTVTVATSNITATAGSDYTAVNTTRTFTPPAIVNTVAVPIVNDTAFEGNETFRLTLSNPLSATLGITTTAVITIFDNDPRPGCTIFNSTDVPKPIPDDKATGVDSVLVIPGAGVVITDVSVRIDQIIHPYINDLDIRLVAPNGTTGVLLVNRAGNPQEQNFIHTVLNDSYPTPIANGPAPFTGNFKPYNSLSSFDSLASGGAWTLNVSDNASGDTGTLNAWGLEVCGSVTAPTHYVYLPLILKK